MGNTLIHIRYGSEQRWKNRNPVLAIGEPAYDSDNEILKIGDGVTNYNSLRPTYANGKIQEVLLDKDNWTGDTAPYTQRVAVDLMKPEFNPNVGLHPSSSYDVALVEVQEYSKLYKGTSEEGFITFYATDLPKCDLVLTIKRL